MITLIIFLYLKKKIYFYKNNYQSEEQIMREGNDFILERVERLDYKLHKIKIK